MASGFPPSSGPANGLIGPVNARGSLALAPKPSIQPGTRLAAIDVGSNAIRLVIGEIDTSGEIRVLKKYRESVRLGKDTFSQGSISKKCAERTLETFVKFKTFLKEQNVKHVRAVGTSALREASNSKALVGEIAKLTGIQVEVIDGLEEGRLIFSAVANRVDLDGSRSVLIDIGGGSVEVTIAEGHKIKATRSFPLGTVRMLEILEQRGLKEKHLPPIIEENFRPVRNYLREQLKGKAVDFAIGTGGNFECLGKLRVALLSKTSIYSMTFEELTELTDHLASMTVKERVQFLRLKNDRADVVVPAALVTLAIMESIPTDTLNIPFVGLRDGILASLLA
jgi:exopolyphosphatase / guanosine-5'-triphosphate,3'-diphosphate pyrophosphatase